MISRFKIKSSFSVNFKRTLRDDTLSLDKDGNLLVEGIFVQKFDLPNDPDHVLRLNTDYIADKDGYRHKYTLVYEEFIDPNRLGAGALKTLAG